MSLPRLDSATVRAYLARLGNPSVSLDLGGLSRLQQAHLRRLPFHNLDVLVPGAGRSGPPSIEAAIEGNIAGNGGTCQQLTPAFVALLHALGFEVEFAAASGQAPGNHLVGVIHLPEGRFIVDVGSGQPYLHPFPLEGGPLDFTAHGRRFRFEREGHEAYRLRRLFADGQETTVYQLTLESQPKDWVEALVAGNHDRSRAGPTLEAVHVARMTDWALATVRRGIYQRFAGGLECARTVEGWEALAGLLRVTFGLPAELVARFLNAVPGGAPRRPGPARPPLRFILSVAAMGRTESVGSLLSSVSELLERGRRSPDSVGVLLLDNGREQGTLGPVLEDAGRRGLRVARVDARDMLWRLAPFQRQGLLPESLTVPLPIGAARTLQASVLREHLRTGALGLPHPDDGGGPVAVWMLDDDLSFRRLCEADGGLRIEPGDDLLARAEALWAEHPHVSVVLGTFTGDPPIPGYATFQVQVHDLAENLRVMAEQSPSAPWRPGAAPRELPDYYYDHARGTTAHLEVGFPWILPGAPPWTVRDAFSTLCTAFAQVPHGRQVTRPLTHRPVPGLSPSRNRGGNALFLDLDALVVAPYPVLRGADGIDTRRADTLWAHLATREPLFHMVQVDFDLLHGRRIGDGSSPLAESRPDVAALRRFVESQERGVVLARLLERDSPAKPADAERELAVRRRLLARSRAGLRQEIEMARGVLEHPDTWWWREESAATSARSCLASLREVETLADAVDALADPELPERLAAFARHVVESLPAWRAVWD